MKSAEPKVFAAGVLLIIVGGEAVWVGGGEVVSLCLAFPGPSALFDYLMG